ncbi:MAG: 3'(2'),5'-bisphosphate nucleotidase CysQ [Boseongicola sp. SB0664_bin_43]|uniref:3'(2'),5'-bisphosphate nucleotidase CysQ n=1 Tax=Boseongicola sp. SB0664_bin_43 TaxID=2604844 RepID=A0A6B0XYQ2_9RHOB|nr:3'(2'),5'-bisphosphate nucleotidase CysQ [Boseongicola sp. SB0664_bin_43]
MPASDLDLLEEAAREAGEIARRFWRGDQQVWDKGKEGPVSEADLAVDRHLKERLLNMRPDYGWVSEESEDNPARLSARRVFIVDPIDGTRSFIAGERTWAHSLAVAEEGRVVAACVFLPVRDKIYLAATGVGATLNGAPISALRRERLDGASLLSTRAGLRPEYWSGGPPDVRRHFRSSFAYRLTLVAEGSFDAVLTFRPTWEWDIAAGALIATESGARVSDRSGRSPQFNSGTRQVDGLIAGGQTVHGELLKRLA